MLLQGALFFHGENNHILDMEIYPEKPVGVVFLTSLRDIALEEYNGQIVKINGEDCYMKGIIEHTIEQSTNGVLKGLIEVKGIITDDTPDDLNGRFPIFPEKGKWIFPKEIFDENKIFNIPSLFRKLPKGNTIERENYKSLFETEILDKVLSIGADVIISDGYMARIDYLQKELGMYGKIINIHPAPAIEGMVYCFRGKDEVMDAIRFAKTHNGFAKTGATLHLIDSKIDNGLPIAYICNTPVYGNDEEIHLMYRNYKQAKLPLFIVGIKHYVLKMYPYVEELKALT